jgi:hypothetical protein
MYMPTERKEGAQRRRGVGFSRAKGPAEHMSWTSLAVYLALVLAWLLYCGLHTFHIGRMPLPRSQALAIGVSFAAFVSLAAAWVMLGLRVLGRRLGWSHQPGLLDRRWVRVALLLLLVLSAGAYLYGRYVEPRWLVVRELRLGQAGRDAVRIAVISDLHITKDGPPWTELARAVNDTRPDMILLLGDTLNRGAALPVLHRVLGAMKAPRGKFAVRGNWEAWYWSQLPLLEGTGFRWLQGPSPTVTRTVRGITVHLAGLPYRDGRAPGDAEALVSRLPADGGWRLFLYHTPDLAPVPSADLYLAGHTHGGQVALPFFGALVTLSHHGKRFERGRVQVGRTVVYTNPGIGVEPMIPLRVGVRPEVTLVKLGRRGATTGVAR